MKAVRLIEPTRLGIVDVDIPAAEPGQVVLRVLAAGVCQTDVHLRRTREAWVPLGTTLGHETVEEITEIGSGVSGWTLGDVVAVYPVRSMRGMQLRTAERLSPHRGAVIARLDSWCERGRRNGRIHGRTGKRGG